MQFTTSKLSSSKRKFKNKSYRGTLDQIRIINEHHRIMKTTHPDLKTDMDILLYLIGESTLSKSPNKRIITRTMAVVKKVLLCESLCYRDNQFQHINRTKSGIKYTPISPDYKETLEHCGDCGGYFKVYKDLSKYISWVEDVE